MDIYGVILAGGRGERFWPLSLPSYPKPFLKLLNEDKTLIELTLNRLLQFLPPQNILIILTQQHIEIAKKILTYFPQENYIIEPSGRDTAAAVGLASLYCGLKNEDALMLIIPADHFIGETDLFIKCLRIGSELAYKKDLIVTFGIIPTRPDTNYGYIKINNKLDSIDGVEIYQVEKFVEKPDEIKAKMYYTSGEFYWNSGMFIWKVGVFQQLMHEFMPQHWAILSEFLDIKKRTVNVDEKNYLKLHKISVDYGILEKVEGERVLMIKAEFKWDDIGGWRSLERIKSSDKEGNIIIGDNNICIDTRDCLVYTEEANRKIATFGVEGLIIVSSGDNILVCSKDKAEDLKQLVRQVLKERME